MQGSFAIAEIDASRDPGLPPPQIRVPAAGVTMRVVARTATGVPVAQLALLVTHNGRVVPPAVLATLAEIQRRPRRTDPRGELLLAAMPVGQYEFRPYTMEQEGESLAADPRSVPPVYRGYFGPGEAVLELVIERKP